MEFRQQGNPGPPRAGDHLHQGHLPQVAEEYLYRVVDALDEVAKLDAASAMAPVYPYWHQRQFVERNPFPTT